MTVPASGWVSVPAVAWVLDDAPDVPPALVSTLIGIARHADQDGHNSYPSLKTLARYTRKSTRQVRSDLRVLEKLGLITLGDQSATACLPGNRRPTVYDLPLHWRRTVIHREEVGFLPVDAREEVQRRQGGSTASSGGKWASSKEARRSQKKASAPALQIIIDNTDATPDEATVVADLVQRERTPRSLPGLLRHLARSGDLQPWLDRVRADTRRAGIGAWLATLKDMPPCPHGVIGGNQRRPDTRQPQCPLCRVSHCSLGQLDDIAESG